MNVFSDDEIANMHDTALRIIEELGIKVLLPEARKIFAQGGARVDETNQMVYIGRDMVEAAINSAPKSINCIAGARNRDIKMELGCLTFQPGAGCPNATDLERGRRAGSGRDFRELIQLTHHFDVFQMLPPLVEAQDVPTHLRHYFTLDACLTLSDKFPFLYSRGTPQAMDNFEMLQDFRGLSDAMAQGIIDFARFGQMPIITPFTLMGAMAPITVAGAVTLSHAEVLAAVTLNQLTRPGAPICYGTFTSNVDMKSGAPALGTPTHFHLSGFPGDLLQVLQPTSTTSKPPTKTRWGCGAA